MLYSGLGQMIALGLVTALPFAGRAELSTSSFAFWALLSTIASTSVVLDLGGTGLIAGAYGATSDRAGLFKRGLAASLIGTAAVGMLASAAWIPYQHKNPSITVGVGLAQIWLVSLGGAIRSLVACISSVALSIDRIALRNNFLIIQACTQALITVLLLLCHVGVSSLAIGLIVSSCVPAIVGVRWVRRTHLVVASASMPADLSYLSFFGWRTLAIVLGTILTQADRWVIGTVGNASLLSRYELAARIATAPKLVILAIAAIITADAGSAAWPAVDDMYARAQRTSSILLAIITIGAVPLGLVVALHEPGVTIGTFLPLLLALTIAHSVNSLTTVGTYILVGVQRPELEIPYLGLAVAIAVIGWTAGSIAHSSLLCIATVVAALILASVYFLYDFRRRLEGEETDARMAV